MTADLSALIARLEAAEVGSRELDAHVEVVARAFEAAKTGLARELWAKWIVSRDFGVEDEHTAYQPAPVTTSLDAALALAERVLPEWRVFGISDERDFQVNRGWGAGVGEKTGPGIQHAKAPTPALALCTAILRAIQGEG